MKNREILNEHLHELFLYELQDVLSAEKQQLNGLKKMKDEALDKELHETLTKHVNQTLGQIDRLKQVFEYLGLSSRSKICKTMQMLLVEADEIIFDFDRNLTRDTALIAVAQKVEHYEIATYRTLVTYAKLMGYGALECLLQETLEEEKEADRLLTGIILNKHNLDELS